jgi:hypothetical protein
LGFTFCAEQGNRRISKDNEPINDLDEDEGAMPWELHTRKAVERVIEYVELDETREVVYVLSGENHRFNTYREGIFSADDLRNRLEKIAENEWASYAPVDEEPGFGLSQFDRSGNRYFASRAGASNGPYLSESASAGREDSYCPYAGGHGGNVLGHLSTIGPNVGHQTAAKICKRPSC